MAGSSNVISGVTYNGVSMTASTTFLSGIDPNTGAWGKQTYFLAAPTSGANTVQVNHSGTQTSAAMSVSYTGAAQTGFPDSQNSGTGVATPVTGSTTVVNANAWTIMFPYISNNTLSTSTGSTSRQIAGVGQAGWFQSGTFDSNGTVGSGSHNMAYAAGGVTTSMWSMVSLAPYIAPATNGNFLAFM